MSLPRIDFLQFTVAEIEPGQDFQTQGHCGKVKSRSDHNVAHLQLLTNVPTKYQLPTSSYIQFLRYSPPAHPDTHTETMGENNILTA